MPDRIPRPLTHAQQLDALRDESEILRAQAETLRERSIMLREQSMAVRARQQALLQRVVDTLEQGLRVQEQIRVFLAQTPSADPISDAGDSAREVD